MHACKIILMPLVLGTTVSALLITSEQEQKESFFQRNLLHVCTLYRHLAIDIVCSNEIANKQLESIKVDTASLTKCKSHS